MRAKVFIPVLVIAVVLVSLLVLLPRRHEPAKPAAENGMGMAAGEQDLARANYEGSARQDKAQRTSGTANPSKSRNGNSDPAASANVEGHSEGLAAGDHAATATREHTAIASSHDRSNKAEQIDEARQMAVETRVQELLDLGMEEDPQSLQTILSELSNADPEIRSAAVEATVQFGSRDAIPELENAMFWAENAEQRKAIADAIEFLKLPKITEVAASLQSPPKLNLGGKAAVPHLVPAARGR